MNHLGFWLLVALFDELGEVLAMSLGAMIALALLELEDKHLLTLVYGEIYIIESRLHLRVVLEGEVPEFDYRFSSFQISPPWSGSLSVPLQQHMPCKGFRLLRSKRSFR